MKFLHSTEIIVDLDYSSDVPILHTPSSTSVHDTSDMQLAIAIAKTGRAVALGVALAATDGPLPIMDIAGFAVASALTFRAWYEYFS